MAPQESLRKEPPRFRVTNRSRESFLTLDVTVFDTTVETLEKLLEGLSLQTSSGLWLTPYRGIPAVPGLPSFDLIYLDEDYRVIQEVESYPCPNIAPLNAQPATALVLPAYTSFASRIQPGDQLAFGPAGEAEGMEHRFELLSSPNYPAPAAQRTESQASELPGISDPPSSQSNDRSRQLQLVIQQLDDREKAESQVRKKYPWPIRFLRWLFFDADGRRGSARLPLPGLVAYHWTGGAPQAYHLANISSGGFYLLTEERPFPGTMILMTLQKTDTDGEDPRDSIAVSTRVVRWGPDGVGLAFVPSRYAGTKSGDPHPGNGSDRKTLEVFIKRLNLLEPR